MILTFGISTKKTSCYVCTHIAQHLCSFMHFVSQVCLQFSSNQCHFCIRILGFQNNKKKQVLLESFITRFCLKNYVNIDQDSHYGRIHLVLNKTLLNGTLMNNTSIKWAQIKTFLCLIQFC